MNSSPEFLRGCICGALIGSGLSSILVMSLCLLFTKGAP